MLGTVLCFLLRTLLYRVSLSSADLFSILPRPKFIQDLNRKTEIYHLRVFQINSDGIIYRGDFLLVLGLGHPELLLVLHHVGQHRPAWTTSQCNTPLHTGVE